ncbi:Exodeoxyribonuclease V beta chain (EC [Olavius sp. associated proteobacterium Delta 1]|nr:Exodeoxyribonuclease V beta chain (EC [Olavius sp. associated proteobacterium Delta 1]
MKPFDLLNAPLEGINLIEASAGTGKTYNIEGLYLRLILEMQLQVDQILVLTFTNAATEELKDRIRNKLASAKDAFGQGASADPLTAALLKKYPDAKAAGLRLHDSLIDFDQAAIFTIHGFCQRVLHENAFETQNLFDTELVTDQTHLMQEVADDFWRKTFYHAPLELISFVLNRNNGPDYFYRLLGGLKTPDVKIVPDLAEPALDALTLYRASLSAVKNAWPAASQAAIQALTDPALNANIYGGPKPAKNHPELTQRELQVSILVEAMDNLADPINIGFPLFKHFERFTTSKLVKSTKKNHKPPEHEFFDLCDDLLRREAQLNAELETYLVYLKTQLLAFALSELPKKKKEQNVQYFDDLLITLIDALQSKSGDVLQNAIRQKYKAALVDEFQDTDNTQYQILTRLFSHKTSLLFLIGDPKQAIYSFRGADIFSYMQAARSAAAKFTLTDNWRSQPQLIIAVNTIFGNNKAPFVFGEIPFAAGNPARQAANQNQSSSPPLTLWYLEAGRFSADENLINKGDAIQLIADAVGAEINRLTSEPSPVAPGDIAVLVRTNDQAQLIKNVLGSRNVPSVLYSTGNIFDTREASEVEKALQAIADPTDIAHLKAALATDIVGMPAEDLITDDLESGRWESRLLRFSDYHRLWDRYGFIRMFRLFLAQEQVRGRLLSLPDGERRLTNVLHLTEVLHRRSMDKNAGITDLLKWLAEQREPRTPRLEEHQLRLESDEKAVKIVTIHKSKGLEYPIVFCPFGWEKSLIRNEEFTFHDIDDDLRLTLDLGSDAGNHHIALAQNEILSENLRLLYVALTRAKDRCYLVWGRINTAETSALAYLLHCDINLQSGIPTEDFTQHTKEQFLAKTDAEFVEDLRQLYRRSQNSIRIEPLPAPTGWDTIIRPQKECEIPCFARKFNGIIDYSWKISSYSSLVSAGLPDVDLPDRDVARNVFQPDKLIPSAVPRPERNRNDISIFSFPKGARAGIFFHDIFEHYDFATTNSDEAAQLVAKKLQQYGFDLIWQETVCRTLTNVLSISLHPDLAKLKLSSIRMRDRANEMEFYFPIKHLSPRNLSKIFRLNPQAEKLKTFSGNLAKLEFRPLRGFMKGYIDLVFQYEGRFYLVDWKSNYLGPILDDYDQEALFQTMQTDLYTLQYHLYALALHQYLRYQKPGYSYEENFGGVFYVFIRGVDHTRGPETGIFFDRPAPELIHRLGGTLIPGYGETE